jgi:hypothetical protein
VQHLCKGLGRGPEVKALAWGVVVDGHEPAEAAGRDRCEIGFAGHEAAHSSDRVLDTALLPGRVGITEEGLDRQAVQPVMTRELSAVVEGDGLTKWLRQAAEQIEEMTSDAIGSFAGQPDREQETGLALVHGEDRLTVFCEHHQVGFPVTAGRAVGGLNRSFCQGNTAFNEVLRSAALPAPASAFAFAARQIAPPAIVPGAGKLGVNEAVDALIGDDLAAPLALESACDLLR